jgi:uncharacterized protein (DUF1697 family)
LAVPFRFLALLRGINVGGNNKVPMAELRARFVAHGFTDVVTYIQSGNVVFSSSEQDPRALEAKITRLLEDDFAVKTRTLVIAARDLARVVDEAPPGFGGTPDTHRFDVLFVLPPTTPSDVRAVISTKEGVDAAFTGTHALYFTRLIARATSSHLTRITQSKVYAALTIRNWNTTVALHALASGAHQTTTSRAAAKKARAKKAPAKKAPAKKAPAKKAPAKKAPAKKAPPKKAPAKKPVKKKPVAKGAR